MRILIIVRISRRLAAMRKRMRVALSFRLMPMPQTFRLFLSTRSGRPEVTVRLKQSPGGELGLFFEDFPIGILDR
jgi:hypothetical protein